MAAALPVFYHGAITRTECEELLGKKNKDGAYLVRDSETIQGAMCLCVYKQRVVYTYRLLQTHNGNYTLMTAGGSNEIFFKNLDDLVRHYKRKNRGLAMHLRHSVKRKTAMLIQSQKHPDPPDPPDPSDPSDPSDPPDPPDPPEAQGRQAPVSEDEHDYENVPDSSEYVEVLPS